MVFTGALRRGSIDASDLAYGSAGDWYPACCGHCLGCPRSIHRPVVDAPQWDVGAGRSTRAAHHRCHARGRWRGGSGAGRSAARDRRAGAMALAEAALRAAVDEGVPWTTADRRLLLVWDGADAAATVSQGVELIRMAVPNPSSLSARATWDAIDRATPRGFVEPVLIPREQLQSWSRPPGPPSPTAIPRDEGDRRWFWRQPWRCLETPDVLRRETASERSKTVVDTEARLPTR